MEEKHEIDYKKVLEHLEKTREYIALSAFIEKDKYVKMLTDVIDFVIETSKLLCDNCQGSYDDCISCRLNTYFSKIKNE